MGESVVDRVRSVIGQVSESHAAFAVLVGLSPDKLSKSLSGARRFTSLELALIAQESGVSVDWLLTGTTPPSLAIARRSGTPATGVDVTAITERFANAYEVLSVKKRIIAAPKFDLPSGGLPPREQGRAAAGIALQLWHEKSSESVHVQRTTDLILLIEKIFGVDVALQSTPDDLDGLAWQSDLHRLIIVASTKNWSRQRFTIAHELGHILFRDAQQVVTDRKITPGADSDDSEARANWFAANFLMPEAEIHKAVKRFSALDADSFAKLVVDFQVSPGAMAVRLLSLGLIDRIQLGRYQRISTIDCHRAAGSFDSFIARVNESDSHRLPPRIVKALFDEYTNGETTLRPLANLLAVSVDRLFEVLEGPVQEQPVADAERELVYQL